MPYDGGTKALALVTDIACWSSLEAEPYQPLSWSGCGPCPFQTRCWTAAEVRKDPSLVLDVDKGLARALHDQGIFNWDDLLAGFDSATLSEFRRPYGSRMQRVGKKAERILLSARALAENGAIWLSAPEIPPGPDWVMFDLEGFPPQLHDDQQVFLWGMQVFGEHPGEYIGALPDVGADGDRIGWERFLTAAEALLDRYGDISFVHWDRYERDRLGKYIARFGDRHDVAARVQRNLFDLLRAVEGSVVLPLPSYSLKVVEGYVGYQRTLEGAGGDWAMASYFQAAESENRAEAERLIDEVCRYNREDLEATWAVLRWVREHASPMRSP
ncbi:MAG: TM0106 family RecB-like putative nuclease [Thermoleophilaceae bacterium]